MAEFGQGRPSDQRKNEEFAGRFGRANSVTVGVTVFLVLLIEKNISGIHP